METTTQPPAKRHNFVLRWTLTGLFTLTVTLIAVQRFNAARPQLDIKNTGQTVVTVLHRGDTLVIQPGQTWHFRFWPGAAMTIHAGDTVSAPSRTVVLERRGLESGMLSTVPVEVKVENGTNILFQYTGIQ